VFLSVFIFDLDDAPVEFTHIDRTIIIEITVFNHGSIVFWVDIIFWVDNTIIVRIIVVDDFNGIGFDVTTVPRSWAFSTWEWRITIEHTVIWAVFLSPRVFRDNETVVDFT